MRTILLGGLLLLLPASSHADEKFYVSPVIHPDRSVTFSLYAPDASKVSVELVRSGTQSAGETEMVADEDGIWSATLGPFEPEIYYYLFNTDGSKHCDYRNRNVKRWLRSVSAFEIPGTQPMPYAVQDVDHGSLHYTYYRSKATGAQRSVNIYVPPSFSEDQKYPLLVLLHGYGEDNRSWIDNGRINYIIDNLAAKGLVRPFIVAMPDCHPNGREYIDNEEPEWETYTAYNKKNRTLMGEDLLGSLLPFLVENYGVDCPMGQNAILGVSMTGEHAIRIGLANTDVFDAVISFSGPVMPSQYKSIPAFNEKRDEADSKVSLLWIMYGQYEAKDHPQAEKFHAWLTEQRIDHVWSVPEGGHEWDAWRRELLQVLPRVFPKDTPEITLRAKN